MKKITEGREVVPSYHKQKEMEKGGWGGGRTRKDGGGKGQRSKM